MNDNNRKKQKALFVIFWFLPLLATLSIISNTSKTAAKENVEHWMNSIPEDCKVENDTLVCNDIIFSKNAIKTLQDFKYQISEKIINNKDDNCYVIKTHSNILKDFLPVKYYKANSDYTMVVTCSKSKKIYRNIYEYSLENINNELVEKMGCEKHNIRTATIIRDRENFTIIPKGLSYSCEDLNPSILSSSEMFNHLFLKECSLRLIEEKENPFGLCQKMYNVIKNPKLKRDTTGLIKNIDEKDFDKYELIK